MRIRQARRRRNAARDRLLELRREQQERALEMDAVRAAHAANTQKAQVRGPPSLSSEFGPVFVTVDSRC